MNNASTKMENTIRSVKETGVFESAKDMMDSAKKTIDTFNINVEKGQEIGDELGIDWAKIDFEQFGMGLEVELEHGSVDPRTNVTNNDPILTAKIALAHLNELPDYYSRLKKLEDG